MPASIRNTLLWLLVTTLLLAWLASAWLVYRESHREIDALLDAQLRQSAQLLKAPRDTDAQPAERHRDDGDENDDEARSLDRFETGFAWQLRGADGQLQQRSASAPETPFSDVQPGFMSLRHEGREWRVYTLRHGDGATIVQVAEDHFARERIARDIALESLAPLLVVLPILGLAIGWVVRRSLRPLESLGAEIARRSGDELSPLAVGPMPPELEPLTRRIDELFSRIRASVDAERRFTSHAAHELRTPVAALRAQAEVAGTTGDPAVRAAALNHCIEACDRMTRLVSQLLLLARADELAALPDARPCRLDHIAQQVLAEAAPMAARRGIELELDTPAACVVTGDADLLAALLRNLVDNALRHARTQVLVELRAQPAQVECAVTDDGPGVDTEALPQLGQRFYRALGARGAGSGLGLSIVSRIVALHRGCVAFVNRAPTATGFVAKVVLPR